MDKLATSFSYVDGMVSESRAVRGELIPITVFTKLSKTEASGKRFFSYVNEMPAYAGEFIWGERNTHDLHIADVFVSKDWLDSFKSMVVEPSPFDFLIWPASDETPKLLVFDMDSTFIEIEVIDELARLHGVGTQVAKVTEAAMRGELDFAKSLVSRVACLKGLSESSIDDICHRLPLSSGVQALIEVCHQRNVKIAIVSGGFTPFVGFLKEAMGLYKVKANCLEIKDGLLTGKVLGDIVDAQAKADFILELNEELGIKTEQFMTIGDGANDLVMMRETGFSLAYRAKPAVQKQAKGRMNSTHLNHLADIFGWK